ncbi:MAG: RHS repeat-associated core domain-containing protein [Firmicutes bacterium]|nr:RHS repeat-associated core domain-containing protein [Bacillota bacterium]
MNQNLFKKESSVLIGRYVYDAWGNHTIYDAAGSVINPYTPHAMTANPWRYRGYYWDQETNFYFLQSRYYDPQIGRFLNADEPVMLFLTATMPGGANLFAYCMNNPIMLTDSTGCSPFWDFLKEYIGWATMALVAVECGLSIATGFVLRTLPIPGINEIGKTLVGAGVGGLFSMGGSVFEQLTDKGYVNPWQLAFNGKIGYWTGFAVSAPMGPISTGIAVGALSVLQSVGNDLFNNNFDGSKINWERAVYMGVACGMTAGIFKAFAGRLPGYEIAFSAAGGLYRVGFSWLFKYA